MEISVQGTHEETVPPEIGRLHVAASTEGGDKAQVLRQATEVVQLLSTEFKRLQESDAVTEVVVRPIGTSSWRPINKGRQQAPIYRASAAMHADFTDFVALADLAAQFGATEGLELRRVEWRLTEDTRREVENTCLTRAVEQAKDRALAMASAAGESQVEFVQLADPGMLGDRPTESFAAPAPRMAMMRGAGGEDALSGIDIQPEDLTVGGVVQARFRTVG